MGVFNKEINREIKENEEVLDVQQKFLEEVDEKNCDVNHEENEEGNPVF